MTQSTSKVSRATLEPQRTENSAPLIIAGFSERYGADGAAKIPAQWTRFAPLIGHIPWQKGDLTYGVCSGTPDNRGFDYLAGVEVEGTTGLDPRLAVVKLPSRKYAVFFHTDNVATLHATCERIFAEWAPHAAVAPAPFFERYDKRFDPRTGNGGVEIWIPLDK